MFTEKGWAPPTSWMDFADPKYKGKVVFQSMPSSSFGLHGFLMFNRIQGGNDKNVEPGFNNWAKTIGPNVLEYIPSSAKISEMVQTGEAAMFPLTPTAVAALKSKGIPVEYAQPKEGSVVLMVGQCVIANNSEPELAQKLAEFLLRPLAQANVLQFGAQIPTNPKAPGRGRRGSAGGPDQPVDEECRDAGLGQRETPTGPPGTRAGTRTSSADRRLRQGILVARQPGGATRSGHP